MPRAKPPRKRSKRFRVNWKNMAGVSSKRTGTGHAWGLLRCPSHSKECPLRGVFVR